MTTFVRRLNQLALRIRMLVILRSVFDLVALFVGCVLAVILVDYLLILPWFIRLLVLVSGIGFFVFGFFRIVLPAFLFRSSPTQIALRMEDAIPELRGKIASAAEFDSSKISSENVLARNLVHEVEDRLSSFPMSSIIRIRPTLISSTFMVVAVLLASTLMFLNVTLFFTGINRVFLPLGDARWPATTMVVPIVSDGDVHPRGVPLSLSARLEKGDSTTRVSARYSVIRDGVVVSRQRVLLTPQGEGVFERLVDVDGDRLDVTFETFDFTSASSSIEIIDPPSIIRTKLDVVPPEYASGQLPAITLDLGTGTDLRSSPDSPFIEGSAARFKFELSKEIPIPSEIDESWMTTTFGELGAGARFEQEGPRSWTLERTLDKPVSALFTLVDEHGIINTDEISFGIQVVVDREPSAVVIEPTMDQTVLPGAMIPIRAEGRDDVSVESAEILVIKKTNPGLEPDSNEGAPSFEFASGTPNVDMEEVLHLADLGASAGDVFEITAKVSDGYNRNGSTHPVALSNVRRISVIDSTEFSDLIQQQINSVRRNTIQVESMQAEAQERSRSNLDSATMEQSRISQRIANTDDALRDIEKRMSRNNLEDPVIEELLRQSRDIISAAGNSSSAASSQLEDASESNNSETGDDNQPPSDDLDQAISSQQDVRDELTDLVALLDRNEDAWLVTRQVENLIEEITELREQTRQFSRDTMGQTREELSRERRDDLDRLADQQSETARESQEISNSLRERSQIMQESDQQTAESMESAARRSERSELAQTLEDASEQIRENQLTNAQESQEESIETLEQMLDDLKEDRRARAEQLVRELANLVKSIEFLVSTNEDELISLSQVPDSLSPEFNDSIALRVSAQVSLARNTSSVGFEATSSGPGGQRIARRIQSAEQHQGDSIKSLRTADIDIKSSEFELNQSLTKLAEALELARASEEAARAEESRQKRDELRKSYLTLAEREAGLLIETQEIAPEPGEPTSRRTRVKARRLSLDQESIRSELNTILSDNPEIESTILVSRVHEMIDEWSSEVRDQLHDGETGSRVRYREQAIIDSLLDLADILAESDGDDSPFGQNEPNGQGQAGQSQQQQDQQEPPSLFPPVSELKLLRNLQGQIYRQTRAIDEEVDASEAPIARSGSNLSELAEMQSELFDLGTRLLESMKQEDEMESQPNQQKPAPPNREGES